MRTTVAEFVDHWTISHDARNGLADAHWRELVDLGWPALLVPEVHGGLGRGLVDAVGVLEAMGRVAFPGPFLASAGLATIAARRLDLFDRFGGLVTGVQGAVALEESGHGDPVDRVRTRASRRTRAIVSTLFIPTPPAQSKSRQSSNNTVGHF